MFKHFEKTTSQANSTFTRKFEIYFISGQQAYVNHPPLALITAVKKTSTWYFKLLSHMEGPLTVMDIKSQVITIDENEIPNAISIDRVTLVLTKGSRDDEDNTQP